MFSSRSSHAQARSGFCCLSSRYRLCEYDLKNGTIIILKTHSTPFNRDHNDIHQLHQGGDTNGVGRQYSNQTMHALADSLHQ